MKKINHSFVLNNDSKEFQILNAINIQNKRRTFDLCPKHSSFKFNRQ